MFFVHSGSVSFIKSYHIIIYSNLGICPFFLTCKKIYFTLAHPVHNSISENKTCPEPDFVGDSICDDITNIFECDYDGGDCCSQDSLDLYCEACLCYQVYQHDAGTYTVDNM